MTQYIQKIHLQGGGADRFGTEVYDTMAEAWEDLEEFMVEWKQDNPHDDPYLPEDFVVVPVDAPGQ